MTSAPKAIVKTMEPVKILSIATNATVLLDLTGQIFNAVCTLIAIFIDDTLQNGLVLCFVWRIFLDSFFQLMIETDRWILLWNFYSMNQRNCRNHSFAIQEHKTVVIVSKNWRIILIDRLILLIIINVEMMIIWILMP